MHLNSFDIALEARITSAHRTPEVTKEYVQDADQRGCAVFIAAAGMAAHLAGAVAAATVKPVIGVPMNASMDGLDALLSTVQMPGDVPVASMAVGMGGPRNAGLFAVQILALSDADLAQKYAAFKTALVEKIKAKDAAFQSQLSE